MYTPSQHLILGLPETGKTTFLAALWHVLEHGDVEGSLRLLETHGDQSYLNRIAARWGNGQPIGRTLRSEETVVSLRITGPDGAAIEIHFPDLSGESFADQWVYRKCSQNYFDYAATASGLLLFVHPDKVVEPHWIEQRNALAAEAFGTDAAVAPQPTVAAPANPWNPQLAPTAVQLVELLQFLVRPPFTERKLRVGVVVSAWDRVAGLATNPSVWLEQRLPLLFQFLRANGETFPSEIYGISAHGGQLGDPVLLARPPAERIVVVARRSTTHDITVPLRWLMSR